jgi:hypothetical protein
MSINCKRTDELRNFIARGCTYNTIFSCPACTFSALYLFWYWVIQLIINWILSLSRALDGSSSGSRSAIESRLWQFFNSCTHTLDRWLAIDAWSMRREINAFFCWLLHLLKESVDDGAHARRRGTRRRTRRNIYNVHMSNNFESVHLSIRLCLLTIIIKLNVLQVVIFSLTATALQCTLQHGAFIHRWHTRLITSPRRFIHLLMSIEICLDSCRLTLG